MAEIPVERRSGGIPWWVWLLIAAILIALLIWWASDDDDVEVAAVGTTAETAAVMPADTETVAGAPVTDLAMLLPEIPAGMVGREVQLTGVPVQDVVSDAGFWIGPSADRRIYAVLSEERTPNTPMEGKADVNAGATADINGTIRTSDQALQGLAAGTKTDPLPPGIDRYIVVSSYQPRSGT